MKKLGIMVAGALMMVMMLIACGKGIKFTKEQVNKALSNSDFKVTCQESGNNVESFTVEIKDVYVEKISDKAFVKEAVIQLDTNYMECTGYQYNVAKVALAIMQILSLTSEDDTVVGYNELLDRVTDIMAGKSEKNNGWSISLTADNASDSVVISVK